MYDKTKLKITQTHLSPEIKAEIIYLLKEGYSVFSIVEAFDDPIVDRNRVNYLNRQLKTQE